MRKTRSDALPPEVRAERRRQASRDYRARHPERRAKTAKEWRERNPDKIVAHQRKHLDRGLDRYRAAKDKPCADCGGRFPSECMDFDHVPEKGGRGIHRSVSMQRLAKDNPALFEAEVAKCDVVCANCHRIRTKARMP